MIHNSCHSPEITETHEQKLQRYRNSKMCECSEPELWQEVHRIVGPKDIDGVSSLRARLVVQQVATGDAKRNLDFHHRLHPENRSGPSEPTALQNYT